MKKFFIRLLCVFIPNKGLRKKLRQSFKQRACERKKPQVSIQDEGKNTAITLPSGSFENIFIRVKGENNKITFSDTQMSGGTIDVGICGDNCEVVVGKDVHVLGYLKIRIFGNGNRIEIKEDVLFGNLNIICGVDTRFINNGLISVGKQTTFARTSLELYHSDTSIQIGEDCMFSHEIVLHNGDGHPVYDFETGKKINTTSDMKIGDHCWIGTGVWILKNVFLAHDTIVGAKSVVAKSFDKPRIAIAGNPAKIIKTGVVWKREEV